jgi:hypothetical protein
MKKIWTIVAILTLVGLVFTTTRVLASPPDLSGLGKPPVKTPGAHPTPVGPGQAGQNQVDLQGNGNSQGNDNSHGQRVNFRGTIATVSASSLAITLADGSSKVFILDDATIIRIPTLGKAGTATDLKVGMMVNVSALRNAGDLTALTVQLVPGKPAPVRRVGTVTAYTAGASISIQAQDGKTYTFLLTSATRILPDGLADKLAVGARVTVISPRDVAGGTQTATGIVVHPSQTITP